jgi:hypothetical protein
VNWREVYAPTLVEQVEAACIAGRPDDAARYLYDANGARASCPAWEQLGDVTRGVWVERAYAVAGGDLA